MLNYLIIGAGPAGLSCAIEAAQKKRSYLMLDKGCLVNSIYHFPPDITFFSTPDLLQIGNLVFISPSFRPNRVEVLKYYAAVASHYKLNVATYEKVETVTRANGYFHVTAKSHSGAIKKYNAMKVIIATGYYDNPNMLYVPGEEMPKVSHYYGEAFPYRGKEVVVIGGKNSAVEAALDLCRAEAKVTLAHRGKGLSESVKYWIRPEIEKRIERGQITALFESEVTGIWPSAVTVRNNASGDQLNLPNDFVFALTGYRPDIALLKSCGVNVDEETLAPECDPETLETNVKGIHVAGSIVAGKNNNQIFIENSREHGKMIVR